MDLTDLTRDLEATRDDALARIAGAPDVPTLEAIELDVLGRKGRLTVVLRGIGALPAEDRPRVGAVANQVREAIEHHSFSLDSVTIPVTISIGIAACPEHGRDIKSLVGRADRALYRAKETGRNRVSVEPRDGLRRAR